MSIKVRVSYTDEAELYDLLDKLQPDIKKCRISGEQKGKHHNAYITLKEAEAVKNGTCIDPDDAV